MTVDSNFSTILSEITSNDLTNSSLFVNDTTTMTMAIDSMPNHSQIYIALFAVSFLVAALSIYSRWYCEQMMQAQMIASRQGLATTEDPVNQRRQPTRTEKYCDIESSLINMFVIEHDDTICSHHQAEAMESSVCHDNKSAPLDESVSDQEKLDEEVPAIRGRQDADTEDNDETNYHRNIVCSICLDPFRVNDIVSVSPKQFYAKSSSSSSCCHHVFHHVCIKEWLLHQTTCPSCRQEFFDSDERSDMKQHDTSTEDDDNERTNSNSTIKTSNDLTSSHHPPNHNSHTFYCIQHGVMIVPTTTLEQNFHTTATDHKAIPDAPKKEELMLLRQTNQTKSIHEEQCHDENNATTAIISLSCDEEESDATFQETYHADGSANV